MKRRAILKTAASIGGIPVVAAGSFVYGTPVAALV
jgi:hypothetical protein